METRQQTSAGTFIQRHPVLVFYALVFALGIGLPLILFGPGAFLGTGAALTSPTEVDPVTYLSTSAGNLMFALTGILVIALASGRVGLRDLRSRLFRWRVSVRWYAVALLTAPLLMMAIQGVLSLTSKAFLPAVITTDGTASLLVALAAGLVVGLVASFFEEIFWTGFGTHELRKRHGVLATGILVGLPWCVLHLPLVAGTSSGTVPPTLYVTVALFAWPLPYRVLMVWVYDHTQSVLMTVLMHLPIDVCLFVLSPAVAGVPDLIINLVFGATLWVVVAAVVAADRRKLSRGGCGPATPSAAVQHALPM